MRDEKDKKKKIHNANLKTFQLSVRASEILNSSSSYSQQLNPNGRRLCLTSMNHLVLSILYEPGRERELRFVRRAKGLGLGDQTFVTNAAESEAARLAVRCLSAWAPRAYLATSLSTALGSASASTSAPATLGTSNASIGLALNELADDHVFRKTLELLMAK